VGHLRSLRKLWRFSGLTISRKGRCEKSVGYKGQDEIRSGVVKSSSYRQTVARIRPGFLWPIGAGHDKTKISVERRQWVLKDYLMTFDFRGKIVVFEEPDD